MDVLKLGQILRIAGFLITAGAVIWWSQVYGGLIQSAEEYVDGMQGAAIDAACGKYDGSDTVTRCRFQQSYKLRGMSVPGLENFVDCLVASSSLKCQGVSIVSQFSGGGTPYTPTVFWVGIGLFGAGIALQMSAKKESDSTQ